MYMPYVLYILYTLCMYTYKQMEKVLELGRKFCSCHIC